MRDQERVLIAERFPLVSLAIERTLNSDERISVVGLADDFASALKLARRYTPDIVLLEMHLSSAQEGLGLCSALKRLTNPPRVIFLTADNSREAVADSIAVGADTFLHKSIRPEELKEAVLQTGMGRRMWRLGDDYGAGRQASPQLSGCDLMTEREKEVLALLLQRLTNDEIARELHLARQTVKNYVSSILGKLGVPSRKHLFLTGVAS